MIRPHDYIDGSMAEQIAHEVDSDARYSFHQAKLAEDIEDDIAHHKVLDNLDKGAFYKSRLSFHRDAASFWWDRALIGDFKRGALP